MMLLQSCKGVTIFIVIAVQVAVALVSKESPNPSRQNLAATGAPSSKHLEEKVATPKATTNQDPGNLVLFLGCSLDQHMVDNCEEHECPKRGFQFKYSFIRGVSPPYFHQVDGPVSKHADVSTFDRVDSAATSYGNVSMVVISSDLWDIAAWWDQAKRPSPPYDYTTHLDKWAKNDIPALLDHVKQRFPQSKIVFRSAPTTRENTPYGSSPEVMEQLYAYTMAQVINGKFLGEFEFLDYHAIIDQLIIKWKSLGRSKADLFDDEVHPGKAGQDAYMNRIFDMMQAEK